jgi:hypothetical protein
MATEHVRNALENFEREIIWLPNFRNLRVLK